MGRWARIAVIAGGLIVGIASSLSGLVTPLAFPKPPVVDPTSILSGVSAADAKSLREFYAALADIVVRDGLAPEPACRTTFELRGRHRQALQLAFGATSIVGKYAGLGERLDAYLLESVGRVDAPLTADLRRSAAAAFAAIK